jgi:hypothetical protein
MAPLNIGYKFQRAKLDVYTIESELIDVVKGYIRAAAEEGELDDLFEARMQEMDDNDLRRFNEVLTQHIKDGQYDEAVEERAVTLGWSIKE